MEGDHHLDAGDVGGPGMDGLGVLSRGGASATQGQAHHHGHVALAAGHVSDLGHLVEELVAADHHEVGEHQLHHRAQAGQGRANAHAHEPLLRDGGILYTQITILVPQPHGALEVAADDADVLAHLEYGIIPRHLLVQGLPDGVSHHQFSHDLNLPYYQTDAAISTNTSL